MYAGAARSGQAAGGECRHSCEAGEEGHHEEGRHEEDHHEEDRHEEDRHEEDHQEDDQEGHQSGATHEEASPGEGRELTTVERL